MVYKTSRLITTPRRLLKKGEYCVKHSEILTSANFGKSFSINCIMLKIKGLECKRCRSRWDYEPSHLDLQCLQTQILLCLALYGWIYLSQCWFNATFWELTSCFSSASSYLQYQRNRDNNMRSVGRKTVARFSDQVRHKPDCTAIEAS